jgi:hypothetical protein
VSMIFRAICIIYLHFACTKIKFCEHFFFTVIWRQNQKDSSQKNL